MFGLVVSMFSRFPWLSSKLITLVTEMTTLRDMVLMIIILATISQQIENCTSIVLVDLVVLVARVLLSTLSSKMTCRFFEILSNITGKISLGDALYRSEIFY
jgi:hypothetical protein